MMKPLAFLLTAAALACAAVQPAFSRPEGKPASADPVAALAEKLRSDKGERIKAARAVEDFLLNPDAAGKRFVGSDADLAALGALARQWADAADPGKLAALLIVAERGSSAEPRLRQALSPWTGASQIRRTSEAAGAGAFLADAQAQALKVLGDPRVRADLAATANDSAVTVPGGPAALERARRLRERGAGVGTGVFGADRKVQDLVGGSGAAQSLAASSVIKPGGAGGGAASTPSLVQNANAAATSAPGVQLPRSQGRPDGISVPPPDGADDEVETPAPVVKPNDGRVVPREVSAWERVKESVTSPLSDAYGFTFEGLEPAPVSFRKHQAAVAYAGKSPAGAFTKVILYGHGAPGYMTVGEWGGDASDISSLLKDKMKAGATLEIKGCNTSSIGGANVNPARGLSALTRRVMYFSVPYLTGDRSEASREQLEKDWDSNLARDVSLNLRGTKVCGFRTFGLVADRIPVVGTLFGRREATDSDAIGGSKACYVNGVEAK